MIAGNERVSRESVERTAYIVGAASAAALALRDAESMTEPAFFRLGRYLVVVDLAAVLPVPEREQP